MALSLLFLLLSLTPISLSEVFVSIDCGSDSDSYIDSNSIKWMGDETLITEGKSYMVEDSDSTSYVLSTLRAFTGGTRKKYCYGIKAEKGGQVLVRSSFYYGNYDKRNSPPSFDVHGDGNLWGTVSFSDDDPMFVLESIYVAKWDTISVCVAQTKEGQFPFISAIEARSVGSKMYGHVDASFALLTRQMVAYGSTDSVRYPDDAYDREWIPENIDHGYTKLTNDALSININVTDDPPQAVLENAVTTSSTSKPLILSTVIDQDDVPIYLNMYFSEVAELEPTEKRSFVFTIDGRVASEPIEPPYGSVLQMYLTNTTASRTTTYALVATKNSTLPPLINAMELLYVFGPLTNGTNAKDLQGLASLQQKFSKLTQFGDPCLPSTFTWNWVNCSSQNTPRITALYLAGYNLQGSIPDFSSLEALETIDLRKNGLTGPIPEFLGNLRNLKELNLEDNNLSGPIPASLSNNTKLKLYTSGNRILCQSTKSASCNERSKSKSSSSKVEIKSAKLAIIIGAIVSTFFIFS